MRASFESVGVEPGQQEGGTACNHTAEVCPRVSRALEMLLLADQPLLVPAAELSRASRLEILVEELQVGDIVRSGAFSVGRC